MHGFPGGVSAQSIRTETLGGHSRPGEWWPPLFIVGNPVPRADRRALALVKVSSPTRTSRGLRLTAAGLRLERLLGDETTPRRTAL